MKLSREKIQRMIEGTGGTGGGGGSTGGGGDLSRISLNTLIDVRINDPEDDQIIVYDEEEEMWLNKEKSIPWPKVTYQMIGNTFNFVDEYPANGQVFINFTDREGNNIPTAITEYRFSNGRKANANVTVKAYNFIGDSAVSVASDERKKDIEGSIRLDLDEIASAPSVTFKWKGEKDGKDHVGTIAQYWREVLPEVVSEDSEGMLSMQYGVAALVSVISLAKEVKELKEKLEAHGIR